MENNIIYDAYYLISLFNKDNNTVTQLQVQKIMYFFEAYYMAINTDVEQLYQCNFNAWAFGPVSIPLYKEFKKYGENPIILDDEKKEIGNSISDNKKRMIDYIYKVFGKLPAIKLVELTHREDSPWYSTWVKNGSKVVYGEKSYIDKIETRDWFRKVFMNG